MATKHSPEKPLPEELAYISELDECQRRHYLALQAIRLGREGVCKINKKMGISKTTLYKGIRELREGDVLEPGRVRRRGGGRRPLLPQHPEWTEVLLRVVEPYRAGLPQDGDVYWISLSVPAIRRKMAEAGCEISCHIIRQILDRLGFRERSFSKNITLKDVEDRDAQFRNIKDIREKCIEVGLPVLSIDTKKKEMLGNFKRSGRVLSVGRPECLDHDFATFSEGHIVPHGIYDVADNTGYMTIGTSHDTSLFVADNVERVWTEHLHDKYPDADTMVVLCDGGGSNSSSHHIVKQDFMDLADRLGMNILVMHYPPYCSKFNPIEHRLFSQITRSWSGAPLLSAQDAARRAAETTTSKGLTVYVDIVDKEYHIKRKVSEDHAERLRRQVVFQSKLPKWNYLIKPSPV